MNKFKSTALFIILLQLLFLSCRKDFLDTPPELLVVREKYVSDLPTLHSYHNGVFADYTQYLCNSYNVVYADLVSDNVKPKAGVTSLLFQYSWTQKAKEKGTLGGDASATEMNSMWVSGYRIIRGANYVLENIEKYKTQNPAKADTIKGQALALRAITHFQLCNVFAQPYNFSSNASHPGIPYITTSDLTQPVSRESVADVYDRAIDDLKYAVSLLPNLAQPANSLLITKNAGKALLARVYLFKNDYGNAKQMAEEVSTDIPLMGSTDYPTKLYSAQDQESLLKLPPEQKSFITIFPNYSYLMRKEFVATSDIVSILREDLNDSRSKWLQQDGLNWNIVKFPTGAIAGLTYPEIAYYFSVIRSSETHLIAAEANAKLGNEDAARTYVNKIRKRANPAALNITATGPALLDSIYKERRKELCFENIRLFDLLRVGKPIERIDAPAQSKTLTYPNDKAIAPIPILDVNQYGLSQNVGY